MKKTISVLLFCAVAISFIFASANEFVLYGKDSLFKESRFDPYAFSTKIGTVFLPDRNHMKMDVRVLVSDENQTFLKYINLAVEDTSDLHPFYINAKFAANANFFNYICKKYSATYEIQTVVKAYLNTFSKANNGFINYGSDFSFFIGEELRINDIVNIRLGLHHLSGHWSDTVYRKLEERYNINTTNDSTIKKFITVDGITYRYYAPVVYERNNDILLSVDYNIKGGFRPYVQVAVPLSNAYVRPFIHAGNYIDVMRLFYGEGFPVQKETHYDNKLRKEAYNTNVKDNLYCTMRINLGLEWEKSLKYCDFYAGIDTQLNQDGQTKHEIGGYSKSNPWEFELTVGAGVELKNVLSNRVVSFEASFKKGRIPLLNLFYENTGMLALTFGIR